MGRLSAAAVTPIENEPFFCDADVVKIGSNSRPNSLSYLSFYGFRTIIVYHLKKSFEIKRRKKILIEKNNFNFFFKIVNIL